MIDRSYHMTHMIELTITICTITGHSYPRIVSLPNNFITGLGITELIYYGRLIHVPNVVYSFIGS